MEMPMNILILSTNIMKNMYSRVGWEGKQRLAGCQGANYVAKPAFRYLNWDMHGVDWQNNPVSTSMVPGAQNMFYTQATSQSSQKTWNEAQPVKPF